MSRYTKLNHWIVRGPSLALAAVLSFHAPTIVRAEDDLVEPVQKAAAATVGVEVSTEAKHPAPGTANGPGTFDISFSNLQSGIVVGADGLIVTYASPGDETKFTVIPPQGAKLEAKPLVKDERTGLCLLKVDGKDWPVIGLSTDKLVLGQRIISVGSDGKTPLASTGIIGAVDRDISPQLPRVAQMDIALGPMSSGGPVVNTKGELIAVVISLPQPRHVNTMFTNLMGPAHGQGGPRIAGSVAAVPALPVNPNAIPPDAPRFATRVAPHAGAMADPMDFLFINRSFNPAGTSAEDRWSYALPARHVQALLKARKGDELVVLRVPFLGVYLQSDSQEAGAMITRVTDESPAAKAMLAEGDRIIVVDGKPVTSASDLTRLINEKSPGDKIEIRIEREGKQKSLPVELVDLERFRREEPFMKALGSLKRTKEQQKAARAELQRAETQAKEAIQYRISRTQPGVMVLKKGAVKGAPAGKEDEAAGTWDVIIEKALPHIRMLEREPDKGIEKLASEVESVRAEMKQLREEVSQLRSLLKETAGKNATGDSPKNSDEPK